MMDLIDRAWAKFMRIAIMILDRLSVYNPLIDPLRTPMRWVRRPGPLAGRDVCILVSWSAELWLSEHAAILCRQWSAQGFAVILTIMSDAPDDFETVGLPECEGVLIRLNRGYDFGAWAATIRCLPDLRQAAVLVIANDSVFGPLDGFPAMIGAVRQHSAGLIGMVHSSEHRHHLQSFLLFFKPIALRSRAFSRFWRSVRDGGREQAIRRYELRLEDFFARYAVPVAALFPLPLRDENGSNPTLQQWQALLERGFPFVKLQLLRDNPFGTDISGWRRAVAERGYDPAVIDRYLARNPPRPIAEQMPS